MIVEKNKSFYTSAPESPGDLARSGLRGSTRARARARADGARRSRTFYSYIVASFSRFFEFFPRAPRVVPVSSSSREK
jgi:hypothetical protein